MLNRNTRPQRLSLMSPVIGLAASVIALALAVVQALKICLAVLEEQPMDGLQAAPQRGNPESNW